VAAKVRQQCFVKPVVFMPQPCAMEWVIAVPQRTTYPPGDVLKVLRN